MIKISAGAFVQPSNPCPSKFLAAPLGMDNKGHHDIEMVGFEQARLQVDSWDLRGTETSLVVNTYKGLKEEVGFKFCQISVNAINDRTLKTYIQQSSFF